MTEQSELLRVLPDIIINFRNVAYIELTGKGGMDLHFVGKQRPLHLNATEAESLRDYVSGESVKDVTGADKPHVVHRRKA